jgi:hypothetical protein
VGKYGKRDIEARDTQLIVEEEAKKMWNGFTNKILFCCTHS